MADKKRPPLPKFNTPVGVGRYPHLNSPDTRFDDEGVYKCDLLLPVEADDTQELITYLEGIRDERYKAEKADAKKGKKFSKAAVFELELDDAGDETGNLILKTKLNAVGRDKSGKEWTNEPRLFDSNGNPMPSETQIWSGSKLIIAGTVNSYAMVKEVIIEKKGKQTKKKITYVGVSLKCKGVQVLELVTGGEATAESFGFGTHSDGYQTEAAEAGLGKGPADDEEGEEGEEDEEDF